MKVVNHTTYRTRDLRKFFRAALEAQGADVKTTHITLQFTRRSYCHGRAACPGSWIKLFIPRKDNLNIGTLARVLEHEITHNLGVHHGDMDPSIKACGVYANSAEMPEWAREIEIQAVPEKHMTSSERILARKAKARRMLKKWKRRLELSKTKVKKWTRTVNYYARGTATP